MVGNGAVGETDSLGLEIGVTCSTNLIATPRSARRGMHERGLSTDLKGVKVDRKWCRLVVSGSFALGYNIVAADNNVWNVRAPQYDLSIPPPRSNEDERKMAMAHENDHYETYVEFIKYIDQLNAKQGKFSFGLYDDTMLQSNILKIYSEAVARSQKFDVSYLIQ